MPLHRNPPKVRTKIAAAGNAKLRELGLIHKFDSEKARAAGLKSAENRKLKRMRKEQEESERYNAELNRLRTKGH